MQSKKEIKHDDSKQTKQQAEKEKLKNIIVPKYKVF